MKQIAKAIVGAGCLIAGSISFTTMPGSNSDILAWAFMIVGAVMCISATAFNDDSSDDEEQTKE